MATKKSNESIDEKAFQALEAALKIDFDDLKSALNDKTSLDEPEEQVSEHAKQATAPDQARAARAPQEAVKPRGEKRRAAWLQRPRRSSRR